LDSDSSGRQKPEESRDAKQGKPPAKEQKVPPGPKGLFKPRRPFEENNDKSETRLFSAHQKAEVEAEAEELGEFAPDGGGGLKKELRVKSAETGSLPTNIQTRPALKELPSRPKRPVPGKASHAAGLRRPPRPQRITTKKPSKSPEGKGGAPPAQRSLRSRRRPKLAGRPRRKRTTSPPSSEEETQARQVETTRETSSKTRKEPPREIRKEAGREAGKEASREMHDRPPAGPEGEHPREPRKEVRREIQRETPGGQDRKLPRRPQREPRKASRTERQRRGHQDQSKEGPFQKPPEEARRKQPGEEVRRPRGRGAPQARTVRKQQSGLLSTRKARPIAMKKPPRVDPAEEALRKKAVPYEWGRTDRFSPDQKKFLERVFKQFAENVTTEMAPLLKTRVTIEYQGARLRPYSVFLQSLYEPISLVILRLDPETRGLMVIDFPLSFALIDRCLGGLGQPLEEIRYFTEIEVAILERVVSRLIASYQEAWSEIKECKPQYLEMQFNPQTVHIAKPSDTMVCISFDIRVAQASGPIYVVIPFNYLKAVLPKTHFEEFMLTRSSPPQAGPSVAPLFAKNLDAAMIPLSVELGTTDLNFGELAVLEVGDFIQLDQEITEPLRVKVNERTKFLGRPGLRSTKLSVQITRILQEGDDEFDE